MSDLKVTQTQSPQNTGKVAFGLGSSPTKVSGAAALVQQVILELLSDFDPNRGRGSGLQTLVTTAGPQEKERTQQDIVSAISSAKAHILINQQGGSALTPQERLQDLRALEVSSPDGVYWNIEIEVINAAGESRTTSVNV